MMEGLNDENVPTNANHLKFLIIRLFLHIFGVKNRMIFQQYCQIWLYNLCRYQSFSFCSFSNGHLRGLEFFQ